jgi:hypothetical protein
LRGIQAELTILSLWQAGFALTGEAWSDQVKIIC